MYGSRNESGQSPPSVILGRQREHQVDVADWHQTCFAGGELARAAAPLDLRRVGRPANKGRKRQGVVNIVVAR
jgi:hypothetical protein